MAQCRTCNGAGSQPHPHWLDYWRDVFDGQMSADDVPACIRFFNDRNHDTLPANRIQCDACHGSGQTPKPETSEASVCFLTI